jgi:sulfate transport system ATP-binding protein
LQPSASPLSSPDSRSSRSRSNLYWNGVTPAKSLPRVVIDKATKPLVVEGIAKRFGTLPALHGIDLTVKPGTFLALLGPSGSGKTTLLRILGGLEYPDAGAVSFDGQDWLSIPARERRVGFMFQHYALFRYMTVAENIAFGLKVRPRRDRPAKAEIARRVEELLALVQLEGLGKRYPNQLSGGQRQRVALARALAIEPKMLLLDEPFGALDTKVRKELRRWLRGLHQQLGLTTIFVTHDQEEALDLADEVAVMRDGKLEQAASPHVIYAQPCNAFVAEFLGGSNALSGRVSSGRFLLDDAVFPLEEPAGFEGAAVGLVRPHEFALANSEEPGLALTVVNVLVGGSQLRLDCARLDGQILEVVLPPMDVSPQRGDKLRLKLTVQRIYPATAT